MSIRPQIVSEGEKVTLRQVSILCNIASDQGVATAHQSFVIRCTTFLLTNVVVSEASKGGVKVGGISPNNSPYIMGPLILPTFIPPFGA